MEHGSRAGFLALPVLAAIALWSCAAGPSASSVGLSASPSPAGSPAVPVTPLSPAGLTRPSSTARLAVLSPTPNQVVNGTILHVVVSVTGATIVAATTTDIRPDQGHIHLYVDNNLVSMNYGTTQDLPVAPGTHILRAEFVASDHAPFDPRVVTPDVVFTVQP
jgi:hypothetical protein